MRIRVRSLSRCVVAAAMPGILEALPPAAQDPTAEPPSASGADEAAPPGDPPAEHSVSPDDDPFEKIRDSRPVPQRRTAPPENPPAPPPEEGAAEESSEKLVRAFFGRHREAQKVLTTARARCTVLSLVANSDGPLQEKGVVAWKRMPDGSVRQRWDLTSEDADENVSTAVVLVSGDEIVYLQEGKVVERGPLRAPDAFHYASLGGLVFLAPSEEELKDPDFAFTLGEGETFSAGLRPRKAPWTDLLDQVVLVFAKKGGYVESAEFRENTGTEYRIRFSGFERNPEIDEKIFEMPPR